MKLHLLVAGLDLDRSVVADRIGWNHIGPVDDARSVASGGRGGGHFGHVFAVASERNLLHTDDLDNFPAWDDSVHVELSGFDRPP
jgi:hypothetical protein